MRKLPPTYSHSVITFSRHSSNENKSVQLIMSMLDVLFYLIAFVFVSDCKDTNLY